ncbi:MAG: hypothetical protein FD134_2593 [Gallionellaceae bacterium]|nr:MAG: hypothetical protein FD134_2593 [Gallionellaceae bacterium]
MDPKNKVIPDFGAFVDGMRLSESLVFLISGSGDSEQVYFDCEKFFRKLTLLMISRQENKFVITENINELGRRSLTLGDIVEAVDEKIQLF